MEKEQIISAFQFRHACKEFDPTRKISVEDFKFILETASLSPTSFGLEPGKLVVLQDMRIRERLKSVTWGAQKQLPTSSHYVIVLARTKVGMVADSEHIQYMIRDVQQLSPESAQKKTQIYHNFLENEFKLLENERAMFEWACRQTYIALGNMMTSAAMIGIDSCPIEGFDRAQVEQILRDEGILHGEEFSIACMVAFGYRVVEPRAKTRQPIDRLVEWIG